MPPNLQTNRYLSEFSSFGIGGPIRFFLEIRTAQEALQAFAWAQSSQMAVRVIGKGSNSLFSDAPFDGLVLLNKIDDCRFQGSEAIVGAGLSFSYLGTQSAKMGFTGLEFASGIPATVGGAIWMNAGANGVETCECLTHVEYLFATGAVRTFERSELTFGYRKSSFQSMEGSILSARFLLTLSPDAREKQLKIINARIKTQPLKEKSLGCIFRNPSKEMSAGALIDQCGLKGLAVGDAVVSPVHANFIVNTNKAKSTDVTALIEKIQAEVLKKTGIYLEPEIKIW